MCRARLSRGVWMERISDFTNRVRYSPSRQSATSQQTSTPDLQLAINLPHPIFTPATKAEEGHHDENISFKVMASQVGDATALELEAKTLDVYRRAADYAESRGIILADTKLEWGRLPNKDLLLIDEVLTPDSSRYWPKDTYQPGTSPTSFDKQFVRDWLETTSWDKASPPPALPDDVVARTVEKYQEALARLTS